MQFAAQLGALTGQWPLIGLVFCLALTLTCQPIPIYSNGLGITRAWPRHAHGLGACYAQLQFCDCFSPVCAHLFAGPSRCLKSEHALGVKFVDLAVSIVSTSQGDEKLDGDVAHKDPEVFSSQPATGQRPPPSCPHRLKSHVGLLDGKGIALSPGRVTTLTVATRCSLAFRFLSMTMMPTARAKQAATLMYANVQSLEASLARALLSRPRRGHVGTEAGRDGYDTCCVRWWMGGGPPLVWESCVVK